MVRISCRIGWLTVLLGLLPSVSFGIGEAFGPPIDWQCGYQSSIPNFNEFTREYISQGRCSGEATSGDYAGQAFSFMVDVRTTWTRNFKTVEEKVIYFYPPELGGIMKTGTLSAACSDDPVLYEGTCSNVTSTGVYGEGIPAGLLASTWIPEQKKAQMREMIEKQLHMPEIESPLDNYLYAEGFEAPSGKYKIPFFVTLPVKKNVRLSFTQRPMIGTGEPNTWSYDIYESEITCSPYGNATICAGKDEFDLDQGRYEVKVQSFSGNAFSDAATVDFVVGKTMADIEGIKAASALREITPGSKAAMAPELFGANAKTMRISGPSMLGQKEKIQGDEALLGELLLKEKRMYRTGEVVQFLVQGDLPAEPVLECAADENHWGMTCPPGSSLRTLGSGPQRRYLIQGGGPGLYRLRYGEKISDAIEVGLAPQGVLKPTEVKPTAPMKLVQPARKSGVAVQVAAPNAVKLPSLWFDLHLAPVSRPQLGVPFDIVIGLKNIGEAPNDSNGAHRVVARLSCQGATDGCEKLIGDPVVSSVAPGASASLRLNAAFKATKAGSYRVVLKLDPEPKLPAGQTMDSQLRASYEFEFRIQEMLNHQQQQIQANQPAAGQKMTTTPANTGGSSNKGVLIKKMK